MARLSPLAITALIAASFGCDSNVQSKPSASEGGSTAVECPAGSERCPCYGNSTCDGSLVCASDLCVRLQPAAGGASAAVGGGASTGGGTDMPGHGGASTQTSGTITYVSGGSPTTSGGSPTTSGGSPTTSGSSPATSGGNPAISGGTAGAGGTQELGGRSGLGGTIAGGGSSAIASGCSAATDLIANAALSEIDNWFGSDPYEKADDPCGFQGSIFAYSDDGLDRLAGTADDSLRFPQSDTASTDPRARIAPCNGGRCCISGATTLWPRIGAEPDKTASVWGAALALDFNDPGEGGRKLAYLGRAKGLVVKLSGTLGGQELRFLYRQSEGDMCAPYTSTTTLGTFVLPFTGATCPTWTCYAATCKPAGASPFALDIFVVGGDTAGPFDICLESVTPIL